MRIAITGSGYVGLVAGACFAEMGLKVTCIDKDRHRIAQLKKGIVPLYEPGLTEMVIRNREKGTLEFSDNAAQEVNNADVLFIAVGTPPLENGGVDLSSVEETARMIGECLEKPLLIVIKSTVPVGTAVRVRNWILEGLVRRGVEVFFEVASNPEFLKEGGAIRDFMSPDRVVIGTDSPVAVEILKKIYSPLLLANSRLLVMDPASAEMTKYASNAMLATRVSFMNEIANLCEKTGADINHVREAMGKDARIGDRFLYPGCGYGGSCFPKDLKALSSLAGEYNLEMKILNAVEEVNSCQKSLLYHKIVSGLHKPGEKPECIALWGLSFKPGTDDLREAPSLTLVEQLLGEGFRIQAYDPAAMENARERWGDTVELYEEKYGAVQDADILVLVTEWKEFRLPDWGRIKSMMRGRRIVDGRNLYSRKVLEAEGFHYQGIGF